MDSFELKLYGLPLLLNFEIDKDLRLSPIPTRNYDFSARANVRFQRWLAAY